MELWTIFVATTPGCTAITLHNSSLPLQNDGTWHMRGDPSVTTKWHRFNDLYRFLWLVFKGDSESEIVVSLSQDSEGPMHFEIKDIGQNTTSALENASRTIEVPHETFYVSSILLWCFHFLEGFPSNNSPLTTNCQDPRVSRVYLGGDFLFHYKMTNMGSPTTWRTKVPSCNITSLNLNWPFYGWHRSIEFVKIPK